MSPPSPTRPRFLASPWLVVLLVLVLYGGVLWVRLERQGFDASRLIEAGDAYCDPARTPVGLAVLRGSDGYDGQFFYRLALDPLTTREIDFGIQLDNPPYRQQRILYPLLVHALSLGRPPYVPACMVLVNVAALAGLAWAAGAMARAAGQPAIIGLLIPLYCGLPLSLARSTGEILAVALLAAGLLALQRGRSGAAAAWLVLAALARETAIVVALAAGLVVGWWWLRGLRGLRGWRAQRPALWPVALLPCLALGLWQVHLWSVWGRVPALSAGYNVDWPLSGLAWLCEHLVGPDRGLVRLHIALLGYLGFFSLCATAALMEREAAPVLRLAWLMYAALALCLSPLVWCEDWAFLRALGEFHLVGAALLIQSRRLALLRGAVLLAALPLWFAVVRKRF